MLGIVRRVYVEKKNGFDIEAKSLYIDLKNTLGLSNLKGIKIINRYDIENISDEVYEDAKKFIFSEATVDIVSDEEIIIDKESKCFEIEYLPGQYDQRADSASQCIQILTHKERPIVKTGKVIVVEGNINNEEFNKIKEYCINPVEAYEVEMKKPEKLEVEIIRPEDVEIFSGFTNLEDKGLKEFLDENGFAMDVEDLKFCRKYFKEEGRDPSVTELKMIDTYWSDHCRHTTFLTKINEVEFDKGQTSNMVKAVFEDYKKSRENVYASRINEKDICLMDVATIVTKELKKKGVLNDLDESEEINACSIKVNVNVDGKDEEWLVMFKNETHNHPTEIEPFGGAATCLGGAIRDPLSGRSYVYQAMRVTGSGDPNTSLKDTIAGKLTQRKITTGAAAGYSSYGNQIGLATGQVTEIYDEGYVAKRMEIGAVIGAAPKENVIRETPKPSDVIILLGGRTGRDGCGGATGSSKAHTEESLESCGAEVQKGNPPEERKIQRLFRNKKVTNMIKRCNDFGAGGVSVAIGELCDGIDIYLDKVPKKYEGLDGTELAISESQERMAVVVSKENAEEFISEANKENLEATQVAEVTDSNRLRMFWRGKTIVDISREFLNSNGAKKYTDAFITEPLNDKNIFINNYMEIKDKKEIWINNLKRLNVCSQKGLVEMFDSTIGAGTVVMPFGGKYQLTPNESMVAKIPLIDGDTKDGTVMSFGYNPEISMWSPFHGAVYAIVEAIAKITAAGGGYSKARLSLQEYFERLGDSKEKWGKPLAALLGAYLAQNKLGIPAIGGKDSMSGTFMDLNVPPTLVAFAVAMIDIEKCITNEFKENGSKVYYLNLKKDSNNLPDFDYLHKMYKKISKLINECKILSSHTVRSGGISEAVTKMCLGNKKGFYFEKDIKFEDLFNLDYGSIIIEVSNDIDIDLEEIESMLLGYTSDKGTIEVEDISLDIDELINIWKEPLERVFPTKTHDKEDRILQTEYEKGNIIFAKNSFAKPKVFIPIFPGTNCEYDTKKAFEKAGGDVSTFVFNNLNAEKLDESINKMARIINECQIVALPGGFSAGDEPEGSGKFIATVFRNNKIKEAVMNLIKNRDGLMLGICNGFQALIKLGLVPYGEIRDIDEDCSTLTFNTIDRHVSCMVNTKIKSNLSPWFNNVKVGDIHTIPVSHGEGRFVGNEALIDNLFKNGQVATQYVDFKGNATYDIKFNPNGSMYSIEGITSPDGRILGKMGHSERIGSNLYKNIPGNKDQKIFDAGIRYYK
jgi:phosphoribosylformylglycinamidine synthase